MKTGEHNNKSVATNSAWKMLESFSSKGVSMLVSIILARILTPGDYGVIALTSIYIQLTDILIQTGFSTALIRQKEAKEEDYSTTLVISVSMAVVLYLAIFLLSPILAETFSTPVFCPVMRVISLSIFCQAFASVRTAVITREMKFRMLFACTLVSNIISGVLGILMAIGGFGVWSLVVQQVAQQALLTVLLFIKVRIKINFHFSSASARMIVPFSFKVLVSSLLSFVGDSLYSVGIGKAYSVENLGYFNKGGQLPRQFSLYTFGAASSVLLPVLSRYQDDYVSLNHVLRRIFRVVNFIITPMMVGMCCVAEELIIVLLTSKWLPATAILQWSCLYYAVTPAFLVNVQLHFAIGKSDTRIRVEILRIVLLVLLFVAFVLVVKVSIIWIAGLQALVQIVILFVMMYETKQAVGMHLGDVAKDFFPTLGVSAAMLLAILLVKAIEMNVFAKLIAEIAVGVAVFVSLSKCFHLKAFQEVSDIVTKIVSGRRGLSK